MDWWIYVVVIGGIIVVYLTSAFIIRFFMMKAKKKCEALLEKVIPLERDRFDMILEVKNKMENDGRHLPKNMVESTLELEKAYQEVPVDIQKVKSIDDFLLLYYIRYIKEKNLKEKYQAELATLESLVYDNVESDKYPYKEYNNATLKYNAYLNMGFINPFRSGCYPYPTLQLV